MFSTGENTLHFIQAHGFQAGFSRCPELVGGPEGAKQIPFDPTAIYHTFHIECQKRFSSKYFI